jgi:hypothetical protein
MLVFLAIDIFGEHMTKKKLTSSENIMESFTVMNVNDEKKNLVSLNHLSSPILNTPGK